MLDLLELFNQNNIVEYGDFTLKSQRKSNYYVNLKKVISIPNLHKHICDCLIDKIKNIENTMICGAPYGALSYTSYISITKNIPMIFLRKTQKEYGAKKLIEGIQVYKNIILLEDVITTGSSVINSAKILEEYGYNVVKIISIVSRSNEDLKYKNIPIEYIVKII